METNSQGNPEILLHVKNHPLSLGASSVSKVLALVRTPAEQPCLVAQRQRQDSGAFWPPSLAHLTSSRFSERPVSKRMR